MQWHLKGRPESPCLSPGYKAGCPWLMCCVCSNCDVFASDLRVYYWEEKKKSTTKCLSSQNPSGLSDSSIYLHPQKKKKKKKKEVWNSIICTCKYNIYKWANFRCPEYFWGISKSLMTFSYHVHIKYLETQPQICLKCTTAFYPVGMRWIKLPISVPLNRVAQVKSGASQKKNKKTKTLPFILQTNDIINKVKAHLHKAR